MSQNGQLDPPGSAMATAGIKSDETRSASLGRSERRLLTALCYDLVGYTDLLTHSDVEDFHELILAFQRNARRAVASRGGTVRVELGDGGIAIFPLDVDAKDAASLAIHAGLEIVDACRRVGRENGRTDMHVRVGIATSMALIPGSLREPTPDDVTAVALAMAARLQAMAEPDAVLVSQQTRSLARRSHSFSFQGVHHMKGFDEPERIWRALSHRQDVDRFLAFGRLNIPMIGRSAELAKIAEYWSAAVHGRGQIVLIDGEAGMGKSRLLHEIRRMTRAERRKTLLFQCLPGGSRSALHPLLQSVSGFEDERGGRLTVSALARLLEHHGIPDADVIDMFGYLLGAEGVNDEALREAAPELIHEKTDWAARRSLERVCAGGPALIAVEDVHWIDPTSRHVLMGIARAIDRFPALLVVTARPAAAQEWLNVPELRHIPLARLGPNETRSAISAMWPGSRASAVPELFDIVDRITGGVPLFIEEICQWMAENAGLATDELAKAVPPAGSSVLESVLNARLESMGPAKEVARAAAVAGIRFNFTLLREILPEYDDRTLLDALDRLSDAGFLARARLSGAFSYAFRHALIQETIYNTLLRKARQSYHRKLFAALDRNRDIAAWIETASLADHAERAGLIDEAIRLFVKGGEDSSSRSAMTEARNLLEHALELSGQVAETDKRDTMRLSALAALGPVLTSTEGPASTHARKLYEDAIEIARRRPTAERAKWFPIYWGWWFTGADIANERAQAMMSELADVEDVEVQLQIRHCIWAIDYNLGRHESCIATVEAGMALYETGRGRENITLFGGHDAKVCGLVHKGFSQWLTGKTGSALRSLSEARNWAKQIGHVGSIAHAYYNEALLHCYRRDFQALRAVVADIRELTQKYSLRALAATNEILEGWCEGNAGHFELGKNMIRQGLAIHNEIETPDDYPVYCAMLAELLARTGETSAALELLSSAEADAERSGHRYWLANLYYRRAHLLYEQASQDEVIAAELVKSLDIAVEQNAIPLLLSAYDSLVSFGLSPELASQYRDRIERARASVEPGEPLIVNPEPIPRRRSAGSSI